LRVQKQPNRLTDKGQIIDRKQSKYVTFERWIITNMCTYIGHISTAKQTYNNTWQEKTENNSSKKTNPHDCQAVSFRVAENERASAYLAWKQQRNSCIHENSRRISSLKDMTNTSNTLTTNEKNEREAAWNHARQRVTQFSWCFVWSPPPNSPDTGAIRATRNIHGAEGSMDRVWICFDWSAGNCRKMSTTMFANTQKAHHDWFSCSQYSEGEAKIDWLLTCPSCTSATKQ